ncbi:glycosyltransferase family 2 protein [Ferrovum myxofaciens]|uniref:glycosyltransferase family 2 protein n=1 Tax=Ferrovum myxofaciens TaxID=416213 RepID=UPI002355FE36|nr:glycosyltransferase family A protein [Ferrovum myxofaciens]MBU6995347.1 glycosyltransferase family 2 protein [Ferrovum myxofaciens]
MSITVIIPTLCESSRRNLLLRAIESIQVQEQSVQILVVVNGQRFDSNLLETLKARSDIDVLQIFEGSSPKAQLIGRRHVSSEYFSFLDDDDEYLPGALDIRLSLLQQDITADLVVTNGFSSKNGNDRLTYSHMSNVKNYPLKALFQENWLASCNHLFRSSGVPTKYFEDPHPYTEWTWLAYRLALDGKKIIASDVPTFRYNDTPGSLSKSSIFIMSSITLYGRMLSLNPKSDIVKIIRKRLCNAWHNVSVFELKSGHRTKAILAHLRSLTCHWSGLKFTSYTRHLLGNISRNP